MFGLLSFHAIAAARGDGMRPELLELLSRQSRLHASDTKIAYLEHHRATGFTQAGPNPVAACEVNSTDNVVTFSRPATLPEPGLWKAVR
jgi:hypothetical protein